RSLLNVEVGQAVPTMPLVTSSVFATSERKVNYPTYSVIGANLRTIGLAERFVISSDSSHHSSTNAPEAEVDSIISYANTIKPDVAGSSHLPEKELSMGSREVDSDNLHEVFVSRWNVPNDAFLDDLDTSREFIDHLAPLVLFAQIRDMDYEQLFIEFSVGTARQACPNTEVRIRTEYCLSEKRRLESECGKQADLLKSKDDEIERLKALLLLKEAEAAKAARLHVQVHALQNPHWNNAMHDEYNALVKMVLGFLYHGQLDRLVSNDSSQQLGYATRVGFYHNRCDSSLFILRQGSQQVITSLHNEFDMTDLGALNYFLGISATRHSTGLFLSRKQYAIELLARAHMTNCNPSRTPIRIGQAAPQQGDLLQVTVFLGDNLVSWSSKHQQTISRSSAEAEYRGVANVVAETAWLRNLLREIHSPLSAATLVYFQHQRTKHIEIDIHFVRDLVTAGQVRVLHVPSRYQYADYALWEVIINDDSPVPEPPAVAIPDEHLLKFYSIKDAKSLWEAIKIRFGGNKELKKIHKTILEQQYENFVASRSEGLDKTYDRFQKLTSQLELNGEVISQKDANMKLLRSLPPT
nr:ribonuclease H-like domain-containing protein [Tanacetum cinerariifolium]